MKKLLILIFLSVSASVFSQEMDTLNIDTLNIQPQPVKIPIDSILMDISDNISEMEYRLRAMQVQLRYEVQPRYKMYGTENMYNLLKLDTQTGRIWQVQWYLNDDDKEGTWTINGADLSWYNSRFELYPTQNMYQFILLDQTYGRTWHVQWGIGDKKRWIKEIR